MNNHDKIIYFKNLDGLRAIAAFSVIFFHISFWFTYPKTDFYDLLIFALAFGGNGGDLGVTFFFILSGFLITYLMFKEQSENGKLNILFFYFRRILRIWPLYYITLLVGFLIYPLISSLAGHPSTENASTLLYSIFAVNFDHIYNGSTNNGILGVQWSVAIEEQFYLLWPLLFYFFSKKNIFPFLLLVVIFISELFFIKAASWEVKYYHLISNFRFLAFGGLLAYLCYFQREWVDYVMKKISRKINFSLYIICVLLLLFQHKLLVTYLNYKYLSHLLPFLFFGFVITEQNFSNNSFFKIGSFRMLNWLGKISYGLYLTHMIAIYIVIGLFPVANSEYVGLKIILTVALTISISYLSYTYIELFFLSLKNKFSVIQKTFGKK